MSETTGLTKDAGWELGVRTTVPAPIGPVWDYLLGEGLRVWLGDIDALPTEKGAAYQTRDGVSGVLRSRTDGVRVRIGWRSPEVAHDTILQLTVKEAASGTTIGFHQERLADRGERKLLLGHWKGVAERLQAVFATDDAR